MKCSRCAALLALISLSVSACTPSRPASLQPGAAGPQAYAPDAGRTLVAAIRSEPDSLALRPILSGLFASFEFVRALFNADLSRLDDRGTPQPYLAEALPQLNSDTWRVFPDGQMETTWRLKAGIIWHDGVPISAQDFVFAWRVYSTPEFGAASSQSIGAIQEVTATDDRTLVIRWRRPYPDADTLPSADGLPALPRHILESSFQQASPDAFAKNAYWSREYIGLGSYRLEGWEPGSFLEASVFDQHALGRPRIGRVKVVFITNPNTGLANILAGELHFATDSSIGLEQGWTLKGEWEQRGAGTVHFRGNNWRATAFQLRSELATPRAILDQRVRKALAHTVDKQALNESVYHGQNLVSDFMISPLSKWGPALEPALLRYPYDLRRSEQLMNDVGFTKGADGVFTSLADGRFRAELKTATSTDWEAEMTIMASDWRNAGFDIQDAVLPAALSIDPEARVTFPAMFTSTSGFGEKTAASYTTAQIPRVENRWRGGSNRGGWSNPEYDRLLDAFGTTLEPSQRAAQVAQMGRIFSDELPVISLLFVGNPYVRVAALRGPAVVAPEAPITWNIHEWEFQ